MRKIIDNKKTNSPFGVFFYLPLFIIASIGMYNLAKIFIYSFTNYDLIEKPTFVGLENYSNIFKDEYVQKIFGNTLLMFFAVTGLLIVTAVLPAIFTARLKLPFGLGIMCGFFLISFIMLSGCFLVIFGGDSHGILNQWFLSNSIIDEPIMFSQSHAMMLSIIAFWLYCIAPVFSIAFIAVRMRHSFLGTAISICSIPVLMFVGGGVATRIIGYPSVNNSADWIYGLYNDILTTKFEVGFAHAIFTTSLILLVIWCIFVCSIAFGFWALCRKVPSDNTAFKVFGYITFSIALQLIVFASFFVIAYLLRAFMPLDELTLSSGLIPKRPTLSNFSSLQKLLSGAGVPFSRYLINSLLIVPLAIMPVCLLVALPPGAGFSLFKFKKQKLLLLCFIPLIFVSEYVAIYKLGMIDNYFVYAFEFLSSFEFLAAVFSVYIAAKFVFYKGKPRIGEVLLGSFFVLSSFYAVGAIRGIWHNSNLIYSQDLELWGSLGSALAAGGIARSGSGAANDTLMLLATVAVLIIPLVLLFMLYRSYRKNTEQEKIQASIENQEISK